MRIIKVEEIEMFGHSYSTKYFKSLNKAKKYFKELIKSHKKDLANDGDCGYQDRPIEFEDMQLILHEHTGLRRKRANLECWYSSETECGTEWDTEVITITLDQIKIEDESQKVIEKQASIKPKPLIAENDIKIGNLIFGIGTKIYKCKCGNWIGYKDCFCRHCGQKLEWASI